MVICDTKIYINCDLSTQTAINTITIYTVQARFKVSRYLSNDMVRYDTEGALGGAPSLGTLEDMLRMSPDTGVSLHGGPFPSEGNLVYGGGLVYQGL
jgi:hypothetical protein